MIQDREMCQAEKKSSAAMIRTGFWDAPRRDGQSASDIYLLGHCLTSPDRSPIGLFPINMTLTSARLKWERSDVQAGFDRLSSQGELKQMGTWLMVRSWWDHNSVPGPGLDNRVISLLNEAPPELVDEWLENTRTAGIDPSRWLQCVSRYSGNLLPTSTPSTTQGYNNTKTNTPTPIPKSQPHHHTSEGGGSDGHLFGEQPSVELLPESEAFRPHLEAVVSKFGLDFLTAQNLGDELSQRLRDQESNGGVPIGNVGSWLRSLAKKAIEGQPILDRGTSLSQQRLARAKNAQDQDSAAFHAEQALAKITADLGAVEELLRSFDDTELRCFADEACASATIIPKRRAKIEESILKREMPSGIDRALILQIGLKWLSNCEGQK